MSKTFWGLLVSVIFNVVLESGGISPPEAFRHEVIHLLRLALLFAAVGYAIVHVPVLRKWRSSPAANHVMTWIFVLSAGAAMSAAIYWLTRPEAASSETAKVRNEPPISDAAEAPTEPPEREPAKAPVALAEPKAEDPPEQRTPKRSDDTSPAAKSHIQVSVHCALQRLPIRTRPGSTDHLLLINRQMNAARKGHRGLEPLSNVDGEQVLEWPDPRRRDPEPASCVRCEVTNHGAENVSHLTIPLAVRYELEPNYDVHNVFIPLLARERPFVFFVANECPVHTHVHWPRTATARIAGDEQAREFELYTPLSRDPSLGGSMSLGPAKVNPTGNQCGESDTSASRP
jgi:hypothetical protein